MLDFFNYVMEFFTTIWEVLNVSFKGLITLLSAVGNSILIPTLYESHVPAVLGSCMVVVIGLSIIKMILGRDNV